jgi:hypothetical protein
VTTQFSDKRQVWRSILYAILVLETPVQAYLLWAWSAKHGFFGGIVFWLRQSSLDPIFLAAMVDFLIFMLLVGLILLNDWPQGVSKRSWWFPLWCFLYFIFPSLALISYLLWIRPRSSFSSIS